MATVMVKDTITITKNMVSALPFFLHVQNLQRRSFYSSSSSSPSSSSKLAVMLFLKLFCFLVFVFFGFDSPSGTHKRVFVCNVGDTRRYRAAQARGYGIGL